MIDFTINVWIGHLTVWCTNQLFYECFLQYGALFQLIDAFLDVLLHFDFNLDYSWKQSSQLFPKQRNRIGTAKEGAVVEGKREAAA